MFKNPDIQRAVSLNGFAVIDANLHHEVEQLYAYISNHFNFPSANFYYSLLANTFEENKNLQIFFKKILHNFYETNFTDYRNLTESFLMKPARTKEELLLHQDWCYTDEKKYTAYNIWIPLSDVTETNGAMFFLPGSHLWFNNIRSGSLHTARISTYNFPKHKIQTVTLQKGQVLVFHPATFHGSYPNLSYQNRIIATPTIMQRDATFIYYHQSDTEDEVKVFSLSDDQFLKNLQTMAIGGMPDGSEIERLKYAHHIITEGELIARLTNFAT